ncbi:Inosine/uridine-preferring nucleoside hydrolase domain-containing protein [Plasmodiophora brassicae]|uniref:Inosine/uridine-preferring nucleoside hydrolase domain-containing protein n=1 Tax=Plasmodiophora brassicae TaxID=37360 RepID=A0A0G4IMQ1_PLABS|nr:hypothetical protein PBRA_005056 [Plasmodiophora brassicae]SPQ99327.1 unnamed protein product [Plasmodiophora brassicae]
MASLLAIGLTLLLAAVALVAADDKWIVFTDLEPDDAWMVLVLARARIVPSAMVVGAGPQMEMKVARARLWIRTFFPQQVASIEIVRGDTSENVFVAEGAAERLRTTDRINLNEYGVADERVPAIIKDAQRQGDDVRIISAKVMSELFRIWQSDNSIFRSVDAYSYLGFNVRCLYQVATSDVVAAFVNTAFKTHTLFETYPVLGKTNSCGNLTAPCFWVEFDRLCEQSPQLNLIRGLMVDWNKSIMDSCLLDVERVAVNELGASQDDLRTLNSYLLRGDLDKARDTVWEFVDRSIDDVDAKVANLLRHAKVVTSVVLGGLDSQFVFADPLVALYVGNYFPPQTEIKPVKFAVGTGALSGYSLFEPRAENDTTSTAFTVGLGEKLSKDDDTSYLMIVTNALQSLL